jgi:hypothetical protein
MANMANGKEGEHMNVSDYRDLMDAVSDQLASVRSAANDREFDAELQRLVRLGAELRATQCKTAKPKDRDRSVRLQQDIEVLQLMRGSLTPP